MISYVKHKNSSIYFIVINNVRIVTYVCNELNISFEEYVNTIQLCGGKFSPKWGWFLPNEDKAINCCVMLNLLKR